MAIRETIKARRSIHSFKKDVVDTAVLKEIFTYGSYAPSHYMKEPWRIKLYQEKGKQHLVDAILTNYQRLGMIPKNQHAKTVRMLDSMGQFLLDIPHHAVIYLPIEPDPVRYEEEYAAVCAFIQNAQLAAWEFGVGMLWTITPYMHDPEFVAEIGLSKQEKIAAVLQIGYPAKIPRDKGRTPIEEKLELINE